MTTRDIIADLVELIYPMPDGPGEDSDDEAWSMECDDIAREREAFEQVLRVMWGEGVIHDPLLNEIANARNAMLTAQARMRLLVAYGREFTRPRPYRLEDLAQAAGMSVSGVRTTYGDDEVAEVARLTGAKPARRPPEAP